MTESDDDVGGGILGLGSNLMRCGYGFKYSAGDELFWRHARRIGSVAGETHLEMSGAVAIDDLFANMQRRSPRPDCLDHP